MEVKDQHHQDNANEHTNFADLYVEVGHKNTRSCGSTKLDEVLVEHKATKTRYLAKQYHISDPLVAQNIYKDVRFPL